MRLFEDDIAEHDGPYESVKVVRYWNLADDVYELEEDPAAEQCESYRTITAERILYRRKIRNLPVREAFSAHQIILDQPLVPDGPTLRELLDPEVHVAMTFVPFAGLRGAKSCLGRLYCVSGLSFRACPFEDGLPVHADNYGWMLLGIPDDVRRTGESWDLAANLLMASLMSTNAQSLIHELSTRIVTGRVGDTGRLLRIEELENKIKFVTSYKLFRQLKWIVPNANREESVMINADMPETLEEALRLIESNRSRATDALASAISSEALDNTVIAAQLANGADVSTEHPIRNENFTQTLLRRTKEKLLNLDALEDVNDYSATRAIMSEIEAKFDNYVGARRILSYYADLPQIFFTLARRRADAAIEAMLTCYGADAINVTDSDGETALDFALEHDQAAATVLRRHGATVRGIYRAGSRKMREMIMQGSIGFSDDVYKYFLQAVESGFLDLNAMIDFGPEGMSSTATWKVRDEVFDTVPEIHTTNVICHRKKTNIFLESILHDTTGKLIKRCIECGANVNALIEFSRNKTADWDEFGLRFTGFREGLAIMRTPLDLAELSQINVVRELLKRGGAKSYGTLRHEQVVKID